MIESGNKFGICVFLFKRIATMFCSHALPYILAAMKPGKVHHIAIKVSDLVRAEAFYCGLLGLTVERRWPSSEASSDGSGERALWLDLGAGAFLALERAEQVEIMKSENAPGIHLVALQIQPSERAAWVAKLAQAGHPIYQQTNYTIYVRDPEGNRIGLSHWPDAI
jgi:glyoxylase I family protein